MGRKTDLRYFIILNPGSCGGKSKALFRQIKQECLQHGLCCKFAVTHTLDDAERLSRKANYAGFDVVAAVGGDGTINRVISGFYSGDGSRISAAKLGVIYTGTSPDFCLSHGLAVHDIPRAVRALFQMRSKQIGIGKICFPNETRFFACCMNVGFGAQLATSANSGIRAKIGDKAGTFVSLVRELARCRPYTLRLNGKEVAGVINLSIGKTHYVASGLKIKNRLLPEDNRLYVLCIRDRILWHVMRLYRGKTLPLTYQTHLSIEGDAPVEFDGDACGHLPCTVSSASPIEVIYG